MWWALMWNRRSPGVETAWWAVPRTALKGCRPAGRGPEYRRPQASLPMPATTANFAGREAEADRALEAG